MSSLKMEDLSSFGRLAVALDEHLSELTRISGQIERLDIYSEGGLEHAFKLLNQFAEHGKSISEGMKGFSAALEEVRARSEAAAKLVSERAEVIGQRKLEQQQLREQLKQVEQKVNAANAGLAGSKRNGNGDITNEDRLKIKAQLEQLNEELKVFLAEAQAIKETAGQAKFKSVEHDANKLLDALKSSSRKIDKVIGEQ